MLSKQCPKCGSPKYLLVGMRLLGDTSYEKQLKCRKCEWVWYDDQSLISKRNRYVYVWDNERKISVPLHRWVWEQINGRSLSAIEVIHHNNRNKGDNRVPNLALMDRYSHNVQFNGGIQCKRCGHSWYPKGPEVRICPKCKSPYWDKAR